MRIRRQEIGRPGVDVREVAAPAAGDADFFGEAFGVVDQDDAATALRGDGRAHHAGRAGADDGDIEGFHGAHCNRGGWGGAWPRTAILSGLPFRLSDAASGFAPTPAQPPTMLVLGIESSCDETGLALYDTERGLLSHALHSQIAMHREYGGVVPELASRDHIRRALPLLEAGDGRSGRGARRHRRHRVHAGSGPRGRAAGGREHRECARDGAGTSRPSAFTIWKGICCRRFWSMSRRRFRSSRCWCRAATRS